MVKGNPSSVSLFELVVFLTKVDGFGNVPVPVIIFDAVYSGAHVVVVELVVVAAEVEPEEADAEAVVGGEVGTFVTDEDLLVCDVLEAFVVVVDALLVDDALVTEGLLLDEEVLFDVEALLETEELLLREALLLLEVSFVLDAAFVVAEALVVVEA